MKIQNLIGVTVASGLLGACGIDTADFLAAIPDERTVTIQAPESSGDALTQADASLGERSEFYNTTRQMTRDVNNGVRGLIRLIKDIVAQPATSRDGDTVTWGPGGDALSPAIYRFQATKTGEGTYTYVMEYRPKGSKDVEANYVALIEGSSDVSSGVNDGVGEMVLHIDNWTAVEPGSCGSGTLDVTYDTTDEPQFLAVTFDDFSDQCQDDNEHQALEAATYYYSRHPDGSGNFQFTALGDIDRGSGLAGVPEVFAIRSRWSASGEGRADVMISSGDLQINHGLTAVTANECWDELFNLTYADMDPPGIDITHADLATEASCAQGLQEAEYATDLVL